ncbi:MAG: hypothetical protein JRN26_05970 [Nitrososphaerota archaeon]|jgi:rusticyanin|nr:hypothetical protein [Nitrososphaerota archaeon]MDG6926994.1 hypothetical protein [Nitrososphaerota archaeon]MDG6930445.1 hypothetical protein [Nitrososphaerota archaeon]MDG6931486.1 hypothetical protein [Nitrososphaerota archaeon]MDG6936409.1 hypothetical protein [Nitrososphaerota archaeon]
MKKAFALAIIIAIVAAGAIASSWYMVYLPFEYEHESVSYYNRQLGLAGGPGGMMGYHMMGYYNGYLTEYSQEFSINKAISMMNDVPGYARVFPGNDTIVLNSTNVNIVAIATMVTPSELGRAVNLTDMPPSSSATENVFVIYGLVNPTLAIPRGATVTFTLINLDPDDYHNIAITPVPPPYPYYSMMDVMMNVLGVSPMLPPASYQSGTAYGFSFNTVLAYPGTFYYICEYPGHAESGMYGELIVS